MKKRQFKPVEGGRLGRNIYHNIFDELISLPNLFSAWQEFRRGKRSKTDVANFEINLEDNLFQLHQELKNNAYYHFNYSSFFIQDPKLRHIHKAAVRDRVFHQAIFRVLNPIFEPTFIFDSYSSRKNKGIHKAVERFNHFARKISQNNTRNCWVLKCDVKKFFDSVDHKILLNLIERKIEDGKVVSLVKKIIDSFETEPNKGIPLGNVTSQIFANIYLNQLDQFVKHQLRIKYYIRYTDDFVILDKDTNFLKSLIAKINEFLRKHLKFSLHKEKLSIRKYRGGVDVLGYVSFPHHQILRIKTKNRMFKRMLEKIEELKSGELDEESFNQSLQSYFGLITHCDSYKIQKELENLCQRNLK